MDRGFAWRPMATSDLAGVVEVARVSFPDHFEDRACFENRLSLNPEACFVLADGSTVLGYLVAYPWRADAAPALNVCIDAIPDDASVMYLHDLALSPDARGGGHTREIIERLTDQARSAGWPAVALVAVNRAEAFWARYGFQSRQTPALSAKLSSYGPDARYMIREL